MAGPVPQARTDLEVLAARLGVDIPQEALRHALVHRSYSYENGGVPHNERLEFLGDSVLGLVVTETLFRIHPERPESDLAKFRSAVVKAASCAEVARDLGVGEFLLLGRGEQATGGRDKSSILADATEALIGAVYIELGIGAATDLVHRLFDDLIATASGLGAGLDWKTSLQEMCAQRGLGVPSYVIDDSGPDHAKHFRAAVMIGEVTYPSGAGTSKKDAEQLAAQAAYEAMAAQGVAAASAEGPVA